MSLYESGRSDSLPGDGGLSSSTNSPDATPRDGPRFAAAPNVPNSLTSFGTSVLTRDCIDQSALSTASSDRSMFEDAPDIDRLKTLIDSNRSTESLIERVRTLIDLFSQSNQTIPHWVRTHGIQPGTFRLDLLLTAMLNHAPGCVGPDRAERSQRYVAAAIYACRGDSKDTMDGLNALAITWFAHFLWICEFNGIGFELLTL
ncbi:uncharacterized protein ARMOST_15352 [Armillaria ostoyae]|uniref:Uncharacterized protein n=1 Tax=Armillaria ostoyae TaxID=47428 RepID=A0A284RT52_ARMOS|nr:uncharacterized protein ARMOST_15352 [Armillaria ostoyae]